MIFLGEVDAIEKINYTLTAKDPKQQNLKDLWGSRGWGLRIWDLDLCSLGV